MKTIIRFLRVAAYLVPVLAAAETKGETPVSPQAKPSISFRWLQTDPKSADSLTASIEGKRFSQDELTQRIDQAVSSGRIKELAKYEQEIHSAIRLRLPPEKSDLPSVEAEIVFSDRGGMELCYSATRNYGSGGTSGTQKAGTTIYYRGNDWRMLQSWQDASDATMLLVRTENMPPLEPPHPGPRRDGDTVPGISQIHLAVELREAAAANLTQLDKVTPETSQKALDWLRKRSILLAGSRCRGSRAGRGGGISQLNCAGYATDPRPLRAKPGFILECKFEKVDDERFEKPSLRNSDPASSLAELQAEWDRLDKEYPVLLKTNAYYRGPKETGESPATEFISNLPMKMNIPLFIKPTTAPPEGSPARILVITPSMEIVR